VFEKLGADDEDSVVGWNSSEPLFQPNFSGEAVYPRWPCGGSARSVRLSNRLTPPLNPDKIAGRRPILVGLIGRPVPSQIHSAIW